MPSQHKIDTLKGDKDKFLGYLISDPEFIAIKKKYLANEFMGINNLAGEVYPTDKQYSNFIACVNEISNYFKIKEEIVKKLLLSENLLKYRLGYQPTAIREKDHIELRIGPKTTLKDIKEIWPHINKLQKEIGSTPNKSSNNPELAYAIHKQVIKDRRLSEIFKDYTENKLENFTRPAKINPDENDFRKYYKKVMKGVKK